MKTKTPELDRYLETLMDELYNFQEIAAGLRPSPGDIPKLDGVDIYGETIPLNGIIGGDHIVYLDFRSRFDLDARIDKALAQSRRETAQRLGQLREKAGILLADVAGHKITDHLLAAMLHQAFLLGARYEVDAHGEITTRLFENINVRFYRSSAVNKYLTMIYGEIDRGGHFRFLSAAHPPPVVFSNEFNCIVEISKDRLTTFPPIGTLPPREDIDVKNEASALGYKERYTANEISLMGWGDIMILYTDGLAEHLEGQPRGFPGTLEDILRNIKCLPAREMFAGIKEEILKIGKPTDDVSALIIKRTQ